MKFEYIPLVGPDQTRPPRPPNLLEVGTKRQVISTTMSILPCKRWNNLQDQQTTNNENLPPIILTQVEKPTTVNKVCSLTQWGRWTSDALEVVMDVVERGQLSLRKANKFWHIPITSLLDTWMGKQDQENKGHKVCSKTRRMKHLWPRF